MNSRELKQPFRSALVQARKIPKAKNKSAAIHKLCAMLKDAIGR